MVNLTGVKRKNKKEKKKKRKEKEEEKSFKLELLSSEFLDLLCIHYTFDGCGGTVWIEFDLRTVEVIVMNTRTSPVRMARGKETTRIAHPVSGHTSTITSWKGNIKTLLLHW